MLLDSSLLDLLTSQTKANPRLRQNYDLRNSEMDKSQRMLNAIEPGSIMPIHRHPNTSTTVIIIRGKIRQNFYDDNGNMVETILLDANGSIRAVQIEKGRWHNLENFESGSFLLRLRMGNGNLMNCLKNKKNREFSCAQVELRLAYGSIPSHGAILEIHDKYYR